MIDDSTLVDDGPTSELLDILNESQIEPEFGPDLHVNVASSFSNLGKTVLSKEKIEELRKPFLTPANCKLLGVPRVNPEIWTVLPQKSKQGDFQSQQMLTILSS